MLRLDARPCACAFHVCASSATFPQAICLVACRAAGQTHSPAGVCQLAAFSAFPRKWGFIMHGEGDLINRNNWAILFVAKLSIVMCLVLLPQLLRLWLPRWGEVLAEFSTEWRFHGRSLMDQKHKENTYNLWEGFKRQFGISERNSSDTGLTKSVWLYFLTL